MAFKGGGGLTLSVKATKNIPKVKSSIDLHYDKRPLKGLGYILNGKNPLEIHNEILGAPEMLSNGKRFHEGYLIFHHEITRVNRAGEVPDEVSVAFDQIGHTYFTVEELRIR